MRPQPRVIEACAPRSSERWLWEGLPPTPATWSTRPPTSSIRRRSPRRSRSARSTATSRSRSWTRAGRAAANRQVAAEGATSQPALVQDRDLDVAVDRALLDLRGERLRIELVGGLVNQAPN